MAEINSKAVFDGVTLALRSRYADAGIYGEEVTQDLKGGDFIVNPILPSGKRIGKRRHRRALSFDVLYFPEAGREECLIIQDTLYELFEMITLASGDKLLGVDMSANIIDDVLHFMVSFKYNTLKVVAEEKMGTLEIMQGG